MVDFQGAPHMKIEDKLFIYQKINDIFLNLLVPGCFLKGFFVQRKGFLKWKISHLWKK